MFDGGLRAWEAVGGEPFLDVNVPSRALGELMESVCHAPSFSAQAVEAMIDEGAGIAVVDVRRFDEYQTMSVPTDIHVPGAGVVLRVPDLAPTRHRASGAAPCGRKDDEWSIHCIYRANIQLGSAWCNHAGSGTMMLERLYAIATELLVRVEILRAHYKIDKESAEIVVSLAELIRLRLKSSGPNYHDIAELAGDINQALREAKTSTTGGIFS